MSLEVVQCWRVNTLLKNKLPTPERQRNMLDTGSYVQTANIASMSSKVHSHVHTSQQHFRLVNLTAKEEKRA